MADERKPLNTKQRAFVEAYLTCWNGYRAAIMAGYAETSARHQASRMLSYDNISAAIQERLAQMTMSSNEVLGRLSDHARADMEDFVRADEEDITLTWSIHTMPLTADGEPDIAGTILSLAQQENVVPTDMVLRTETIKRSRARLDLLAAAKNGKLHLIKKYSIDKDGKETIELHDAQTALIQIGKRHKLWTEMHEVAGDLFKIYERTDEFDPDSA